MDKIIHHVRVERWENNYECLASGMKKTVWCRANTISEKQFFYWQRILRKEAYEVIHQANLAAATEKELPTSRSVSFIEVKCPPSESQSTSSFRPDVVIRKGTFTVEISNSASVELLSRIGGMLHAE